MSAEFPFRIDVLKAITATLKTITPGNGYVSDLADFVDGQGQTVSRVYRGRAWFGETDPIPMLSILEAANPATEIGDEPNFTPAKSVYWELLIQGFVKDDSQNPTDPAYVLLADVRRRLAIEKKRRNTSRQPDPFGMGSGVCKITDMEIGFGVVRPADDVSAKAYFWLPLRLAVYEDAERVYT